MNNWSSYRQFNTFLSIGMLLSAIIFFLAYQNNGIQCMHLGLNGQPCPSCGISRDFMDFLRLQFESPINAKSPFLFISLFGQFLFRLTSSIFEGYWPIQKKWIQKDILLSGIHFLIILVYLNL